MKQLSIITILMIVACGCVPAQNHYQKHEIKKALKTIKVNVSALNKMELSNEQIALKLKDLDSDLSNKSIANSSSTVNKNSISQLQKILLQKIYNGISQINSRLVNTKLSKRRLKKIVRKFKDLGITKEK